MHRCTQFTAFWSPSVHSDCPAVPDVWISAPPGTFHLHVCVISAQIRTEVKSEPVAADGRGSKKKKMKIRRSKDRGETGARANCDKQE